MKLSLKVSFAALALLAVMAIGARAAFTNEMGQVVTITTNELGGIVTTITDPNRPDAPVRVRIPLSGSAQVDTNATTTTSAYTPAQPLDYLKGKVGGTNVLWQYLGTAWVEIARE